MDSIETHTPWFLHKKPETEYITKELSINSNQVLNEEKSLRRREKLGKCPVCQGEYSYRSKLGPDLAL